MYHYFVPFKRWLIFHCVATVHHIPFVHSSLTDIWVPFPFWLLQIITAVSLWVQVFLWTCAVVSFGCIPGSGVTGSYARSVSYRSRNCQNLPKRLQHLALPPARAGAAAPPQARWHLSPFSCVKPSWWVGSGVLFIVVLICISLKANGVEHPVIYLLVICILLWRNVYSSPLPLY